MWGLVGGWRLSGLFGLGRLAAQGEAPPARLGIWSLGTPDVVCGVSANGVSDHQFGALISNSPFRAATLSADQPASRNCSQQPRGLTNARGGLLQVSTP